MGIDRGITPAATTQAPGEHPGGLSLEEFLRDMRSVRFPGYPIVFIAAGEELARILQSFSLWPGHPANAFGDCLHVIQLPDIFKVGENILGTIYVKGGGLSLIVRGRGSGGASG